MVLEIGKVSLTTHQSFNLGTKCQHVSIDFHLKWFFPHNWYNSLYLFHLDLAEKARENVKTRWRKLGPLDDEEAFDYEPHDWLPDEDSALELAVETYGKDWKKILDNTKYLRKNFGHLTGE